MDPAQKLQCVLSQWSEITLEIRWQNQVQFRHPTVFALSLQSDSDEVLERFSSQNAVGQIAARAKKRPDSGVTVIGVPNTADT